MHLLSRISATSYDSWVAGSLGNNRIVKNTRKIEMPWDQLAIEASEWRRLINHEELVAARHAAVSAFRTLRVLAVDTHLPADHIDHDTMSAYLAGFPFSWEV